MSHFVHFKPFPQTLLAQTAQVCGVTKLEPLNSCGRRSVDAFSAWTQPRFNGWKERRVKAERVGSDTYLPGRRR